MLDIKPIETEYAGYKFRSRLEARWAVFLEDLNLIFQYEPEGFQFGNGVYYLPDFFLPELNIYIEVKPHGVKIPEVERKKIETFGVFRDILLVKGEPYLQLKDGPSVEWERFWPENEEEGSGGSDSPYIFCVCPWCNKIGIEFDGRGARVCGYKKHYDTEDEARAALPGYEGRVDDKIYTYDNIKIVTAATCARSMRF